MVVASKKTSLEINVDKTKYMVMTRDHNAGRSHNIKLDNSSFERKEQFKYLGILTYQNSIQKEIRSRLTLRRLMSYIYIYMEHPFLMFLDHT